MESAMLWVTIVGIIVIPLIGWAVNTLITRKIDDQNKRLDELELKLDEIKKSFYTALNGQRTAFEVLYVRKDLYDQAIDLHRINSDEKFKSLLSIVTTQYSNLESKINDNNLNMNEKISSLKALINEKFNGYKTGSGM